MTGLFYVKIKKGYRYFSASVFGNSDKPLMLISSVLKQNKQNARQSEAELCTLISADLEKEIKIEQ